MNKLTATIDPREHGDVARTLILPLAAASQTSSVCVLQFSPTLCWLSLVQGNARPHLERGVPRS